MRLYKEHVRRMLRTLLAMSIVAMLLVVPGRAATAGDAAPATQPAQRIFLLHLPGIGGLLRIDRMLTGGLKSGGLDEAEILVYDWTNGDRGLNALGAIQRNKAEARKIARMIQDRLRDEPQARIILTGHSGGSGVAVWALESLPEDVQIDTLVMLAPALSPQYDLSSALRRVRRAYSFNSEYDPVLGPGTQVFGTIDRIMTPAAGRVGFDVPDGADAAQYEKLVQIPYDRGFMLFGHIGDHIGPMRPRFAAKVIAPLLLTGELPMPTTQPATQPTTAPTR